MTDCDKHCQYIADKIRINNMKSRAVDTKIHSPNKIVEYNELYQEHMNLLTDKLVCMDDCRRRNHDNERSSTSGSQDIPVDPELIAELKKLDSDYYDSDDDGGKGGSCGSRRRSIHNKIRRKTKRLRRRGPGRKQTRSRRGRSRRYKK